MEESVYALLFPWLMIIVGVAVYYVTSHYAPQLPYTAVMFIIGVGIGLAVEFTPHNAITFSAETWIGINGEALLLIFLPGLLFLDSYSIDVHLFLKAFWQIVIFAFPMVLVGTFLTALVAYYVFPYGWSFDLCMAFGAILGATDPVAITSLLNELGAPPRLKMHISGESLLNDGSAVVFFNIFSARFFYEFGIPGVGSDVGWGEGFGLFIRLAFGGACIGITFGAATLIILYNLNRRLSGEDAVFQVVTSIACAYLVYFTSEILAGCSGIVAVLFCALVIKGLGEKYYNDAHLSLHFWEITEVLLNTLLFALGGCVWGDIIGKSSLKDNSFSWTSSDWKYLFILFICLIAIRFFSVFLFYPLTAKLGIGSNWKEAVFMSYGGLRGAVGIALALSLHKETEDYTSAILDEDTRTRFTQYSSKLFCMVGGIAMLTLVVNAPSGGLLLKKLGLVTPTETRLKVVENFRKQMVQYTLKQYVKLLTQERFHVVDFAFLRAHVPALKEITHAHLLHAVEHHKDASPSRGYIDPNVQNVVSYFRGQSTSESRDVEKQEDGKLSKHARFKEPEKASPWHLAVKSITKGKKRSRKTVFDMRGTVCQDVVREERIVFLSLVQSAYENFVHSGELEPRSFVALTLAEALEFSMDTSAKGNPLTTWNSVEVASDSWIGPVQAILTFAFRRPNHSHNVGNENMYDRYVINTKVRRVLVFVQAHKWARNKFKDEFTHSNCLTAAEKLVLEECDANIQLAEAKLKLIDPAEVKLAKSQYAAQILLNKGAQYYDNLLKHGLLTKNEAEVFLEEIEEYLFEVWDSLSAEEEVCDISAEQECGHGNASGEKTRLLS